ncbi:MAG: GAF domain-containing protein [Leptolyngbyaceae cyanobacterium RU_5_1]|nr:GAF domain-containing protein [Leptolyngbyaceae cyanobacterium RU_5_1]
MVDQSNATRWPRYQSDEAQHGRADQMPELTDQISESRDDTVSRFKIAIAPKPEKQRSVLVQQFLNLSIQRKQIIALIVCELVPILGLGIGATVVLMNSLRTQLLDQAKSEVAVTEIAYNIKVNQMGFGSRGQSDNPAMITAAKLHTRGRSLQTGQVVQLRQILENEVKARKMEYATLVGKDKQIIINANANRRGQNFDPDGLVSEVLKNGQQVKSSAIVPWSELAKEAPPLPAGFSKQDSLIRYVVSPVRNPDTQEVIGALVFGDVVNGKLPIVEGTLKAFGGGYSAIYQRQPNGQFTLATSLDKGTAANLEQAQSNVPLQNLSLLDKAVASKGSPVTDRMQINGVTYTIAAEAIPNKVVEMPTGSMSGFSQNPSAVLVRGTPEDDLNILLENSLKQQALVLAAGLAVVLLWFILFRRSLARPMHDLMQATQKFAVGDRSARAEIFSTDEIGQLSSTFNYMADNIVATEMALDREARQQMQRSREAQAMKDLVTIIRRSAKAGDILQASLGQIREFLGVERVLVYQFNPDYKSGIIAAESVIPGWIAAIGQTIQDPLAPEALARFNKGEVSFVHNLETANLDHCHCEILKKLQVKANMVAPIKSEKKLIGLLCAHQCSRAREWARSELDFIGQLAAQMGFALDQSGLLERQAEDARLSKELNDITSRMRDALDRKQIFNVVTKDTREAIGSDRVVVYLFDDQWQGTVVAESVGRGFPAALGAGIADPCFAREYVDKYRRGRVQALSDIYAVDLDPCYLSQLEPFAVKANVVTPILMAGNLLGLLVSHQCSGPREWQEVEVNFLRQVAIQLGFALEQATLLRQKEDDARLSKLLNDITSRMREALNRQQTFSVVTKDTREAIAADRVVVYLFDEQWQGTIVAESVGRGYPVALGAGIADPCFAKQYVDKYRQGRVQALSDIYAVKLDPCYLSQLEPFAVKANVVTPILLSGNLLGLLVAHQCSGPREWQEVEINFLRQVATQLGFALEQADLFEQRELARLQAEAVSEEQRRQKEALQQQLVELLEDVEGAASGDLTVRADVTAGEIGTVADFFNSIVESLRQIVSQVKHSAGKVGAALGQNEGAMQDLADEALKQAEETMQTLKSVEQMKQLIQTAADSARQAAEVAHTASATAETGGAAMDLTVQNILGLRETIGETAKKVKRLGESSQQISKVVSLINQIALQTNLLAINAGIEAARAGEEGQGFAVVAEEVGELAARSAAATQEIEQIVDAIQRETSEVVEAMEHGTAQVVEGTHLVKNAKQSLEQILRVSHQIDALVLSVSQATTSQVQTSQAISGLMEEVAQIAGRTSDSSRQVSNSLRDTVSVAKQLQDSVEMFKVN